MNDGQGRLVLVDHEGPVHLMVSRLASRSLRVERASHDELRARVQRGEVDVAILAFERETPDRAEILRTLRLDDRTVSLFACAERGSSRDAVLAFEAGADDYFAHEIEPALLEAKVWRALHRREELFGTRAKGPESHIRELKPHDEIDLFSMTRIEERLCRALSHAQGQTVPFTTLLESVWGRTPPPAYLLYEHVSSLRAKLFVQGFTVRNVRGQGYRLERTGEDAKRPRRRSG